MARQRPSRPSDKLADYAYDVFGDVRVQSGGSGNYWLYTGEQRDSESELYYLRARYLRRQETKTVV